MCRLDVQRTAPSNSTMKRISRLETIAAGSGDGNRVEWTGTTD